MKEKYHELADVGITYILHPANSSRLYEEPQFQVAGFRLSGQETVFAFDSALKNYNGAPTENPEAFVRKYLLEEVDRQLEQRAKEEPDLLANIARKDPRLLAPLLSIAGREWPFAPEFWLTWDRLDEGIVGIDLHRDSFQLDLNTLQFGSKDGAPLSTPLYELLDPVGYWYQIAVKQREAGIASAGYAELARINNFLKDCRSVHVLLKGDREFTFMYRGATAGELFACYGESGRLEIKSCSLFIPNIEAGIPIEEVQTLLHGRDMLEVDVSAIRELFGELPTQAVRQDGLAPSQSM